MKLAIARALNAEYHYIPARRVSKDEIERVWELAHYSSWTGSNWRVIGLPEADLMRIDLQQTFLSLLDGTASLSGISGRHPIETQHTKFCPRAPNEFGALLSVCCFIGLHGSRGMLVLVTDSECADAICAA